MKIKDRLKKNKNENSIFIKTKERNIQEFSIEDIFADSNEIRDYLIEQIKKYRNIILVSSKSFDKLIIAEYINSQIKKENSRIIEDIDSDINNLNGVINIIPNPDIRTVVKILEQILYGCSSFIFGLNLGTYENIINKIKTLIALNYQNLSDTNISTLLASANPIIVCVSKNDDDLLFISKISEIKSDETQLKMNDIYTAEKTVKKIKDNKTEIIEKDKKIKVQKKTGKKNTIKKSDKEVKKTESETIIQNSKPESKTVENIAIENNNISEQTEKPIFNILDIPDEENGINNTEKEETKQEQEFIPAEIQPETADYTENEREKKPNKYQILKEKARQKKLAAQSNINPKV